MFYVALILALSLFSCIAEANTITRPAKSFGGTNFINGVVPQASDFNGDIDTIYGEFNGNIDNANIKTAAAIAATKINPDGFTVNIRTVNTVPCTVIEESDQASDTKRWEACSNGSVFQLGTYTDANALQNNWLTITRANGGFTLGGVAGTNVINGATTFNQTVTFTGGTSLTPTGMVTMYMGTTAPTGWLLMDGASNSCTGASSANAGLCTQLISLFGSVNYKGSGTTVTVDTASDEVIHTAHGKSVGDRVHFSTTVTLPSRTGGGGILLATTVYCVQSTTTDRYKIADTCGGGAIDITTTGSGTHTDYFNFVTPDARGRNPVGTGAGGGLTSRTIGATGGVESAGPTITGSHVLTIAEMPAHTHTVFSTTTGSSALSSGNIGLGGGAQTGSTGGDGGHTHTITPTDTMNPFLVMTYIIKL